MKARIWKWFYDYIGKPIDDISNIELIRKISDYPMEFHLYNNIDYYYKNIKEMQEFLKECEYISDETHFGKKDFWMLPNDFENQKKGDCEDFALYTWRQLLKMEYDARLVIGCVTNNKNGHAWVTAIKDNKALLVDPVLAKLPLIVPSMVSEYIPWYSIGVENYKLRYFVHKPKLIKILSLKLLAYLFTFLVFGLFILSLPVLIIIGSIRKTIIQYGRYLKYRYL